MCLRASFTKEKIAMNNGYKYIYAAYEKEKYLSSRHVWNDYPPHDLLITDKMSYFFHIGHMKNLELQRHNTRWYKTYH